MKVELLISAVNAEPEKLTEKMNVSTNAVLINQCGETGTCEFTVRNGRVRVYSFDEKGVGRSRNRAIENAEGDLLLFADDDIVYDNDYEAVILNEFAKHPEADGLFFNLTVCKERQTYYNTDFGKCHLWNIGRYPAYSFAVRKSALDGRDLKFSLLFGGGAKYSCGEDSIFFKDCIKAGLKLYRTTASIGEEIPRPSTWFKGFNEKFFFDRGVMYSYLYGHLAGIMGLRFVISKRNEMCRSIPAGKAYKLLKSGIKEGIKVQTLGEENAED